MNVVSNSFSVFSGYSMGPKYSYRGWGLNIHTTPKFFLEILLCPWTAAWACTKTVGICATMVLCDRYATGITMRLCCTPLNSGWHRLLLPSQQPCVKAWRHRASPLGLE